MGTIATAWKRGTGDLPVRLHSVSRRLWRLGWDLRSVEIDLVAETARIEMRHGPVLLTFDARNGSATTTREVVEVETTAVGRRGDRFLAERLHHRFMGRERHAGLRSGLRWVADYISHNSDLPALTHEVRDVLRPLLSAQGGAS